MYGRRKRRRRDASFYRGRWCNCFKSDEKEEEEEEEEGGRAAAWGKNGGGGEAMA